MKNLRKQAKELLHMAGKVYHYRRDVLSEAQLTELETAVNELEALYLKKDAEVPKLAAAIENLDDLLRKIGGKIYPKTFWSDNLEVILVAAILVIGFRTFFFQPFIIPTNSMYPTYNGMTYKIHDEEEASPGGIKKTFNLLRFGARHKGLVAKNDGRLLIPVAPVRNIRKESIFLGQSVPGRKWLVFPTKLNEYTFYVGDQPYTLHTPGTFNMNALLNEAFSSDKFVPFDKSPSGIALDTGLYLKANDPILSFDINLGDALFVDRISYHFRRPKVGDPFVFRTNEISRDLGDKYFIKRIAGIGGESLEIVNGALLANGKPRDEVDAFVLNAEKTDGYKGYTNRDLLAEGRQLKIPEGSYVALGDNSGDSNDSRTWGFVPGDAVIGKAIFIYYPFTSHWGPAQ